MGCPNEYGQKMKNWKKIGFKIITVSVEYLPIFEKRARWHFEE